MEYRDYQIENEKGHVVILKDGKFVSTADSPNEAKDDIDEMYLSLEYINSLFNAVS